MWKKYRLSQIFELRPYVLGEELTVRLARPGGVKAGDYIARDPENHDNQWLVESDDFASNFEPI